MEIPPPNLQGAEGPVLSRVVAADLMGVNDRYVSDAMRLREGSAELFERVRAGRLTLVAACAQLSGTTLDGQARRLRSVRTRLNRLLRRPDRYPDLLDQLTQPMDRLEQD